MKGLYIKTMLGVNVSGITICFRCSQDGFITLMDGEAAPSESVKCIHILFALIFVPFYPSVVGRKVLFFVPLQYSLYGGAI